MRSTISAARSSSFRISGRPRTGMSAINVIDAGDANARVRLVAPVQVDDHRCQALERAGARERARVERAAADEPARRARARALSRRRRHRRRARPRRAAAARFAAAIECRPAATGASHELLHPLGEAERVGDRGASLGPSAKLDRARDAEKRRRPERAARPHAPCRAPRRPSRRAREVDAAHRVVVRRTGDAAAAELRRVAAGALGVPRADHDVVLAQRDEPGGERAAEAAGPTEDRRLSRRRSRRIERRSGAAGARPRGRSSASA